MGGRLYTMTLWLCSGFSHDTSVIVTQETNRNYLGQETRLDGSNQN